MVDGSSVGSLLGLLIIALAFVLQLVSSWEGDRTLRKRFLITYAIGVAIMIINGFLTGNNMIAIFEVIIFILVGILVSKEGMHDKDKKKSATKKKRR
jgi:hypothetical protein